MEPIIAIERVSHHYGAGALRRQILHEVCAEVFAGEIVLLSGPSGSGKSTLLTLAGGLRSVQEGSLKVLGRELRGAKNDALLRVREKIGFVFQAHNLLDALSARQNVQISLGMDYSIASAEAIRKADAALDAVGLLHCAGRYPRQLSEGEKQRVAIARALVRQPKIILADEPTASLDRQAGREVVDNLHRLAMQQGCATLMVTHDNRILDIADRVLVLEDGRIGDLLQGPAAQGDGRIDSLVING